MKNHRLAKNFFFVFIVATTVTACAVTVGTKEGDTPPQIVKNPESPDQRIWNDIGMFGPVPDTKKDLGAKTCSTMNNKDTQYVAIGYHSKAKDFNGNTLPQGGFLCVPK